MDKVLYIPGGAEFRPSTVWKKHKVAEYDFNKHLRFQLMVTWWFWVGGLGFESGAFK